MANSMQKKTGILLINLGTPDSPSVKDVRKYLFQFLNDPRVIDISWLSRKILVNGIIVPFRAPKSAKIYKELWEMYDGVSPLITNGNKLKAYVQSQFDASKVKVALGMRYQNPSIESAIDELLTFNPDEIVVLPLFPQYASSSSGSAIEETFRVLNKKWVIPSVKVISQFYDHPKYIDGLVSRGKQYDLKEYDKVLFSFHGLPERQVDKVYSGDTVCKDHNCTEEVDDDAKFCYKATCYATARAVAEKMGIGADGYEVVFQSRLGRDPWIHPYADIRIEELAKEGLKKLLVFSPAFISDCLETSIEIGEEYNELFQEHGGEKVQLVEGLNDHPDFLACVMDLLQKEMTAY